MPRLTPNEFALLKDLQRRSARGERALLMGNADRGPILRLVELGYAEQQIVGADSTAMCWITPEGKEILTALIHARRPAPPDSGV